MQGDLDYGEEALGTSYIHRVSAYYDDIEQYTGSDRIASSPK
jgi:hypothetical protein